ncbi:MAG: ABC transporter permease [Cyanobacteria bacterium]|nr:ABC transporter permease [Cyanobacteriota bacterium]
MLSGLWRDLVYAGRSLARARAFTFVCVVSLGVGMVPVIAVPYFSRVTRTPPPAIRTEGLVEVVTTPLGSRAATDRWSYPDFQDLRAADPGLAIAGWTGAPGKITIDTPAGIETKPVSAMYVSANYFEITGVALARGRAFDQMMDTPAAEPVAILGYEFWQKQLGADPDIVGKTLVLDDIPRVVIGITPQHFDGHLFLHFKELFVPLEQHPRLRDMSADNKARSDRGDEWILTIGHLSPGVSLAQASAAVSGVTARLAKQYPATNENRSGIVVAYHPSGALGRAQLLALQAVALTLTGTVLLVVCLNISGMMQVRSAMRERELSIRQAIGASRKRLVQHLLCEALVLASIAGALASTVLFNLPAIISRLAGQSLPLQVQQALRVDLPNIAICVAACGVTTVLFGLLPATRFSRPVIITTLKDEAGAGGSQAGRVRRVTAALQVAIAVPLIVMSGLSLDQFRATATFDLGFESDLLYSAPLKLPEGAADADFRIRTTRDTLENASGVASATVADGLPLDFRSRTAQVSLRPEAGAAPRFIAVQTTRVGDGYLRTMGIPLLRGRGFTADDRAGAEMVTVISIALARKLFPDTESDGVIGRQLLFGINEQTPLTIVGMTADFPTAQMSSEREQLLLPLAQHASPIVFLIARSAAGEPPQKMTAALDNAVRELGTDFTRDVSYADGLPFAKIVTGLWLRQNSMRDFLVQSAVSGGTGSVILMLAALGVYGVVGLMVAMRTREIAVRIALGASRRRVIGMILVDVVKLVAPGVVVGLILTLALNRLNAENMGISISRMGPIAYVAGGTIAIIVAVLASLAPARRAASVHPMVAMRSL